MSGKPKLDLGSTKEVGEVLFQTLKLPVPHGATKGPNKNPSTANEVGVQYAQCAMPSIHLNQLLFCNVLAAWDHNPVVQPEAPPRLALFFGPEPQAKLLRFTFNIPSIES